MEQVKITFYKIEKCGLYEYGKDSPRLGSLSDFLNQLQAWAKKDGKPLDETCTYAIEEGEDGGRTFCYDIVTCEETGDFLLVTWNETPSFEGKVAAVQAKSHVGSAKIEFTELPKNSIPGYATFFWLLPSSGIMATIRFRHRLNGKKNLEKYMKEFISKFSDYVVLSSCGETDLNIIGYADKPSDTPLGLYSSFQTSIVRKPGEINYIIKQRTQIRKITRHNKLSPRLKASLELWQRIMSTLGLGQDKSLDSDVHFSYEFPFTPSESELATIIKEWEQYHDSKWDDIGFTFI